MRRAPSRVWSRAIPGAMAVCRSASSDATLAALPPLVQRYLRFAEVVGPPRVQGFRARMTGRIRGERDTRAARSAPALATPQRPVRGALHPNSD